MALSPEPDSAATLAALGQALVRSHAAANAALAASARDASRPHLPGLPAELAPPPIRYRLDVLELTLRGYAVPRRVAGEGRHETLFSLHRPPLWQRLRHGAAPAACTLRAGADGVAITLTCRPVPAAGSPAAARMRPAWLARLYAWLSGRRGAAEKAASETDI